jgi:hypothetical protein
MKKSQELGTAAHAHNPTYSGGKGSKIMSSTSAWITQRGPLKAK